jgi:2-amino-4-hydroxy-6-hydroxymethyldihydropteridine diphosphokinase
MGGFRYLLGLGSNVGDRDAALDEALRFLSTWMEWGRLSPRRQTVPLTSSEHDVSDHGPYLNMVAEGSSFLGPRELYARIVIIEDTLGHPRHARWRPRSLDIDILLCSLGGGPGPVEDGVPLFMHCSAAEDGGLVIPHAGTKDRPFLQTLVVDDLKVGRACLAAHGLFQNI